MRLGTSEVSSKTQPPTPVGRLLRMHRRRLSDDDGFTLVELLMVVVIIAVLLAIAIPTLLLARHRSQDRAAQAALRNAVTDAHAIFTDHQNFNQATQTQLTAEEPSLRFVGAAPSTSADEVSTTSACVGACLPGAAANRFVAAAKSGSGLCWFAQSVASTDVTNPGVRWEAVEGVDCVATNAPAFDSVAAPSAWALKPADVTP
jgi:type IV pilus assembly protein PilA